MHALVPTPRPHPPPSPQRAILIWLSILFFGNPVTPFSVLGTAMVILGVLLYNWALRSNKDKAAQSPQHPTSTATAAARTPSGLTSGIVRGRSPVSRRHDSPTNSNV